MSTINEASKPARNRILVVATAGGLTNAGPILEISKILAARGYDIDFGTLQGQEHFAKPYPFISRVHTLGPGVPINVEEREYLRMTEWDIAKGFGPVMQTKQFLDSSWPYVYSALSAIMTDPQRRPDLILGDYLVDAVRDMQIEYDIPIAMHWPQMPFMALPASYIPGHAGLQIEVMTSEHATIRQRLINELVPLRIAPAAIRYKRWLRQMRKAAGVHRMLATPRKPDHLMLVNSFFGVEVPKDLPPNVVAIGPVLADKYDGLDDAMVQFLEIHRRVLYIALGTHVLLGGGALEKILEGVMSSLGDTLIDGVIWSIREMARRQFNLKATARTSSGKLSSVQELLDGHDPSFRFFEFAPQRALLAHPSIRCYLTHGGASSTNESVYHGVPTVTIGIYFDQLQNAIRLRDAGVSVPLDKLRFTAQDLSSAIASIMQDSSGSFRQNCQRLKQVAGVASRRKFLAADMIEEVLFDHQGRRDGPESGRPLHLQTADMRMPYWKANNWDLFALIGGFTIVGLGLVVVLPVMLGKTL
ncbi:MAG: hypothetical protein L6R37_004888 [Teloschistes peruensis]|nr:MAG: hypothetical protein L6R37_004888 [Teloschistes peruensis]